MVAPANLEMIGRGGLDMIDQLKQNSSPMVAQANAEKTGRGGFYTINQLKRNNGSSAPHKSNQREATDCNQAAKMRGGVVFNTQVRTKYVYMPWNKAILK